jgi:hypothetical protein
MYKLQEFPTIVLGGLQKCHGTGATPGSGGTSPAWIQEMDESMVTL